MKAERLLGHRVFKSSSGHASGRVTMPSKRRLILAYHYLACLIIAYFLMRSSVSHTVNPYFLLSSIYSYKISGPRSGELVAMFLPALQIVLACCLVARCAVEVALGWCGVLLASFAIVQVSALARGLNIGCGCFGAAESQQVGASSLLTVAILLTLAITARVALGKSAEISSAGSSLPLA